MNNSQNYIAEKFVSPPKIVARFSELSENEQRLENQEKFSRSKPSGALKIFYESKNFSANVSRVENNFKSVKKKRCRDGTHRDFTEDRKRIRKKSKKTSKPETLIEKNLEKPHILAAIKPQLNKSKVGKIHEVHHEKPDSKLSHHLFRKINEIIVREADETHPPKTESLKPPLSNFLTSMKPNLSSEKTSEAVLKLKDESSFALHQNVTQKNSEKIANKTSALKATISDIGKRRINEILKNHAQKVAKVPQKIILQKETDAEALEDEKAILDSKETPELSIKETLPINEMKNNKQENPVVEDTKSKILEKVNKEPKKSKEEPKSHERESEREERKKLFSTWVNLPQSNELERRLNNSNQEPLFLFLNNKGQKADGREQNIAEEEKKQKFTNVDDIQEGKPKPVKVNDNQKGDEKKIEKRETYTDRLLLLKMIGKKLEDKKKAIEAIEQSQRISNQLERGAPNSEKQEVAPKKQVQPVINPRGQLKSNSVQVTTSKEAIVTEKKEISPLKVEKIFDGETVYKTKQTRSAELRDMVAQAIKEHKIFCIFDNHTYIVRPVREELLNRGWLEIIPDRRLIPRRRPPPMGPVYERASDKTASERNCNTLEAILTAKQNFADELQETVSRSPSFKYTIEKPKIIATAVNISKKKISQESVHEVYSQFCILPPNNEKKKTNIDIREFVAKYHAILEKVKERENDIKKLKEKEKNAKIQKKDKTKTPNTKNKTEERSPTPVETVRPPLSTKKSIQRIADSIKDNNKVILSVVSGISNLEEITGGNISIGVLYDAIQKNVPAVKSKEVQKNEKQENRSPTNTFKNVFTESEARTISKIIQSANARIHFMWLSIKPAIHLKCFNYSPEIINKFQRTTFCTKIGLWSHLSNLQWYAHEVGYPAKSPRMYNTGEADDLQAFFQDFQLTACIGMLKWISDTFFEKGLKGVHAKKGKVPLKAFEFAIRQCEKYIRFRENEDLTAFEEFRVLEEEWNTFLQWFYIITNDHGKVQESSTAQLMVVYTKAAETLKLMKRYWPEIDIDGRLNIWIMKPYCASCGRGIFMTNNVYYIGQHSKYIVQKYIEKPLLIYNTKFDIRQWFLITKLTPLEIWMYKECYLRFCTQPFVLRNLHESVHLSNNSVQRKYISIRDPSLPDQNMWDSKTFQLYLRTIGQPSVWEEIIYPGMRDAIVSTMLSAQETFDGPRKSWFEVYGADFMLSSNLKDGPWLIEINENPAMDPSTKVTARLCPQMLRDVIKVVVDKRANKNASTGQWELVYRQNYSPSYGIVNLDVRGKKIARTPHLNKLASDFPILKTFPNDKKNSEEIGTGKLYDFVNTLGGCQNIGGSSNYFEKYRNKRKLLQSKKGTEADSSLRTSHLLKKFEKQAYDASWECADIKLKNYKAKEEKEVNQSSGDKGGLKKPKGYLFGRKSKKPTNWNSNLMGKKVSTIPLPQFKLRRGKEQLVPKTSVNPMRINF